MSADTMALLTIIIGSLSIIISVCSFRLAVKTNHRMGLDWRFRPLRVVDLEGRTAEQAEAEGLPHIRRS